MTHPGPAHAVAWLRRTFARDDRGFMLPAELEIAARNPDDPLDLATWLKCPEVIEATGLELAKRELWADHTMPVYVINTVMLQCSNCGRQAASYSWPASSAGDGEAPGLRCPTCFGVVIVPVEKGAQIQ